MMSFIAYLTFLLRVANEATLGSSGIVLDFFELGS